MTNTQILFIVLAVAASIATFGAVTAWLSRRDTDVNKILETAQSAIAYSDKIVAAIQPFISSDKAAVVDRIVSAADIAVGAAEQLYDTSQLSKDERKPAAMQYVRDTLALAGVEWTDDVARLADGAIEASVWALGRVEQSGN